MKEEQLGIVVETKGHMATIRAQRHGDCKDCGLCPGQDAMMVEARNPVDAKVGQRVAFEIQQVNMLQAAFIVYLLPLVLAFLGALAGGWIAVKAGGQSKILFQVVGGIIAFGLSLIYIKFYDRSARKNEKMQPVITRIL
jgi:sigma-E factor negative regulatory protein RseC